VDVIGRYVFSRPTYVADELSGYFLVAITFLALGQTQKLGKHLRVDILFSRLSKKKGAWLTLFTSILSLAFLIWFTWSTSVSAMQTYEIGTRKQTILATPYWVPQLLLPIGLCIFSLQLIVSIVQQAKSLRTMG
jgi:TRAP-type C4-dicarboxylate transport system permease small subunit